MHKMIVAASISLFLASCQDGEKGGAKTRPTETGSAVLTTDWPLSKEQAQSLQKEEAAKRRLNIVSPLDLGNNVQLDMVFVPPGTFPMGNSKVRTNPPRLVKISRGFFISTREITWTQFLQVFPEAKLNRMAKDTLLHERKKNKDWGEYSARISWQYADGFCSELARLKGAKSRLPTDAEWEYACRAGTACDYGQWSSIDRSKAHVGTSVNDEGQTFNYERASRSPGGKYAPNFWNIHDMMGVEEEWCQDRYTDLLDVGGKASVDPFVKPIWGCLNVIRGGSWIRAKTVFDRDGDSARSCGIRLLVELAP
ncbi:MAG: formylglycine-generating enzyme family protein [Planctomycetaceae bacterium]|nr:formylglycine-generating enzyme family protein [Planctomycetaceae bacterium]